MYSLEQKSQGGTIGHICETWKASPHVNILSAITQHLTQLSQKFADYLPDDPQHENRWILDPFSVDPSEDMAPSTLLKNELMELSTDSSLELQLTQVDLSSFWILVDSQYPSLSKQAIKFLLPFTDTYLCESGFSMVNVTKSKARNRLKANLNATLCLSPSPNLISLFPKSKSVSLRASKIWSSQLTVACLLFNYFVMYGFLHLFGRYSQDFLTIRSGP